MFQLIVGILSKQYSLYRSVSAAALKQNIALSVGKDLHRWCKNAKGEKTGDGASVGKQDGTQDGKQDGKQDGQ